jgi:hypothetical protein
MSTALNTAKILTPWNGSGASLDSYRPALADDHPVTSWTDQTGADPTKGGSYTIECQCTSSTLAAIQADPKYAGNITVVS